MAIVSEYFTGFQSLIFFEQFLTFNPVKSCDCSPCASRGPLCMFEAQAKMPGLRFQCFFTWQMAWMQQARPFPAAPN